MDKRFIAECEREALHLSGAIQAHGALLICDERRQVTHWSHNLPEFLPDAGPLSPGCPLPQALAAVLDRSVAQGSPRQQFDQVLGRPDSLPLDVTLIRGTHGQLLFELSHGEDADTLHTPPPSQPPASPSGNRPPSLAGLAAQQQALVEQVFALSGFQRVLYYHFRDDGDGEVLAEQHCPDNYGSYLGLRFPASDIPQIARQLYLLNPWRLISDASAPAVALTGLPEPPDLSRSDLRSVSPIHAIYMSNMGVRASLSFPITVAGQLWGLLTCHDTRVRHPPVATLATLAGMVRAHGMQVTATLAQHRMQLVDGLMRRFTPASEIIHRAGSLLTVWPELGVWLGEEFSVDSAQICLGEEQAHWGEGLEAEALAAIDHWFVRTHSDPVWMADSLSRQMPLFPLSQVAGVLAFKARLPDGRFLRVYLGRLEYIHEVAWGGNPDKPVEYHDGQLGIAPRRSFEKWVEKCVGRCRPWGNETRLLALRLRELLLGLAQHERPV